MTLVTQNVTMIKLFGNKETEKIYLGKVSKKYPPEIQQLARRKLKMLHASQNLSDLRIPLQIVWRNCVEHFPPIIASVWTNNGASFLFGMKMMPSMYN